MRDESNEKDGRDMVMRLSLRVVDGCMRVRLRGNADGRTDTPSHRDAWAHQKIEPKIALEPL